MDRFPCTSFTRVMLGGSLGSPSGGYAYLRYLLSVTRIELESCVLGAANNLGRGALLRLEEEGHSAGVCLVVIATQ